jgi:hypothetical protein
MTQPQNGWIETWNTNAAGRRQMLAERLSRKPASPYLGSLRTQYLQRAEAGVNFRHNLAQAYTAHLQGLSRVISAAVAGRASSPPKRTGSLGG